MVLYFYASHLSYFIATPIGIEIIIVTLKCIIISDATHKVEAGNG